MRAVPRPSPPTPSPVSPEPGGCVLARDGNNVKLKYYFPVKALGKLLLEERVEREVVVEGGGSLAWTAGTPDPWGTKVPWPCAWSWGRRGGGGGEVPSPLALSPQGGELGHPPPSPRPAAMAEPGPHSPQAPLPSLPCSITPQHKQSNFYLKKEKQNQTKPGQGEMKTHKEKIQHSHRKCKLHLY